MNDPERLLDSDRTGLTAALIAAGREDAPSERLLADTLAVIGAGTAVVAAGAAATALGAGSSATALKAGGTTSLAALAFKWLGIGAAGGALTVGAAIGVERAASPGPSPREPAAAAAKASPTTEAAPPPVRPALPAAAPPAPLEPVPSVAPSAKKPARLSIADETQALDRARRELASGNARGALLTLDAYDQSPGPRRLQQEALLLRMDALEKSGNPSAAKIVAQSLLDQSPNGPHAARARKILGR